MLKIELFSSDEDYRLLNESNQLVHVICPGPKETDEFESQQKILNNSANFTTITISKFIKDFLKKNNLEENWVDKKKLILNLGVIWKKYFKEISEETFFQCFTIFTDLRSYTLNFDLIKEVADQFDETLFKALEIFWLYLDQAELIDEHRAYALIGNEKEKFKKNNYSKIVVWGFHHLSAIQVDMLRSIAEDIDVIVPFPLEVYLGCDQFDWIKWLDNDAETKLTCKDTSLSELKVVRFDQGKLNQKLSEHLANGKGNDVDIILAEKDPTFYQLLEVSSSGMFFKSTEDIFSAYVALIITEMKHEFAQMRYEKVSMLESLTYLENRIKNTLTDEAKFKHLKIYLILLAIFKEYADLSTSNDFLTLFDFNLLFQVAELSIPRTHCAPLLDDLKKGTILGLSFFNYCNTGKNVILCATSNYSSFKFQANNKYTEKIMSFLATMAPVGGGDLEYLFAKQKVIKILKNQSAILFIENGLEQKEQLWADLFQEFDLQEMTINQSSKSTYPKYIKEKLGQKKHQNLKKISGTKIQTYIDCPLKYYGKYHEKWDKYFVFKNNLMSFQLGQIEHIVIQEYLENHSEYSDKKHAALVTEKIQHCINNEGLNIPRRDFIKYYQEVFNLSEKGIYKLLLFKQSFNNIEFIFEKDIAYINAAGIKIEGRIDCLVKGDFGVGVLDFKRSSGGIPSLIEYNKLEKIQILFYLHHLKIDLAEVAFWGYLNLSEFDKSLFFFKDTALADTLGQLGFLENKPKLVLDNDLIDQYSEYEEKLITKIQNDTEFFAAPIKDAVCNYCSIRNICER